jgi:hypothetical protein
VAAGCRVGWIFPVGWDGALAVLLCVLGGVAPHVATASVSGRPAGPGALLVSVGLAQSVTDRLSVSDIRPQARGEWGGRVDLDYQFSERWAATIAGQVGGSWFDFNGFAVSGKIVDASWSVRTGVDRLIPAGGATLAVGIGLEYGEARSWLDNLVISQEGPHNYTLGGSARVGISSPFLGRVQAYGELLSSFYRGRAQDRTSGNTYHWLGRSLTGAIGMRFALARGHSGLEDDDVQGR